MTSDPGARSRCRVWVVMGPSGSGKSTLGALLAARLEAPFLEGDRFHPPSNLTKMRQGRPLDDEDRWPWLAAVADAARDLAAENRNVVVACSALKRAYRDRLRAGLGEAAEVTLLCPRIDQDILAGRLGRREGHFMPASLLDSQLDAFEPPGPGENAVLLPQGPNPEALVDLCLQAASRTPST